MSDPTYPYPFLSQSVSDDAASSIIHNAFCVERFAPEFFEELSILVPGDMNLNMEEVKRREWLAIASDDSDGVLNAEMDALINWWSQNGIETIYATSRNRLVNHVDGRVLVMKLETLASSIFNKIQLGTWMFGDIPDLAQQRISDWYEDVYFSYPLRFVVLSTYGGFGRTIISGPSSLVKSIKVAATMRHDEYVIHWSELV